MPRTIMQMYHYFAMELLSLGTKFCSAPCCVLWLWPGKDSCVFPGGERLKLKKNTRQRHLDLSTLDLNVDLHLLVTPVMQGCPNSTPSQCYPGSFPTLNAGFAPPPSWPFQTFQEWENITWTTLGWREHYYYYYIKFWYHPSFKDHRIVGWFTI